MALSDLIDPHEPLCLIEGSAPALHHWFEEFDLALKDGDQTRPLPDADASFWEIVFSRDDQRALTLGRRELTVTQCPAYSLFTINCPRERLSGMRGEYDAALIQHDPHSTRLIRWAAGKLSFIPDEVI